MSKDPRSCTICGGQRLLFFRQVPMAPPGQTGRTVRLHACQECGTLIDFDSAAGAGERPIRELDIRFQVEVGADLHLYAFLLCLLRRLAPERCTAAPPRLLDVGAGFGFLVSMASAGGWEAVGLEPASIGRQGGQRLETTIHPVTLEEFEQDPTFDGAGHFEFICALDRIGRVSDPHRTVAAAARSLQPDGTLVVCSPNAEQARAAGEHEWGRLLDAGHRRQLLTPRAMEHLLRSHGFGQVRVLLRGGNSGQEQIVALATRGAAPALQQIPLPEVTIEALAFARDYLESLVRHLEQADQRDMLYGGALHRVVELLVSERFYDEALVYAAKVDQLLDATGVCREEIDRLQPTDLQQYLAVLPAYTAAYLFQRGMINLHHLADNEQALGDFRTAAHLFRVEQSLGLDRAGWHERSLLCAGLAMMGLGQSLTALHLFEALIAQPQSLPPDVRETLYHNKGIAHLQLGEHLAAMSCYTELVLAGLPGAPHGVQHPARQMVVAFNLTIQSLHAELAALGKVVQGLSQKLEHASLSRAPDLLPGVNPEVHQNHGLS